MLHFALARSIAMLFKSILVLTFFASVLAKSENQIVGLSVTVARCAGCGLAPNADNEITIEVLNLIKRPISRHIGSI